MYRLISELSSIAENVTYEKTPDLETEMSFKTAPIAAIEMKTCSMKTTLRTSTTVEETIF